MRSGPRGTGRGRTAVLILAALALAGVCLVCVVSSLLLRPGSGRAEIPPYGGAAWEDGGTAYRTTASKSEVLNYYKVQFAERGFATVSLCPGAGERAEDYHAPHPRIQYGDLDGSGPEFAPSGGVRRTYVNPIGRCGRTVGQTIGHINAQLHVRELNPLSDVWLDYSVDYRPGKGSGGRNLVTVRADEQNQRRWGR